MSTDGKAKTLQSLKEVRQQQNPCFSEILHRQDNGGQYLILRTVKQFPSVHMVNISPAQKGRGAKGLLRERTEKKLSTVPLKMLKFLPLLSPQIS